MINAGRSRVNVATQACESCRRRKSRCDELRPKCSLCQRKGVECHYKEQTHLSPTRRDEHTGRMMEYLERLEDKVDNLTLAGASPASSSSRPRPIAPSSSLQTHGSAYSTLDEKDPLDAVRGPTDITGEAPPYFTAPHRALVWPAIYSRLTRSVPQAKDSLAALSEGGTSWLSAQLDSYCLCSITVAGPIADAILYRAYEMDNFAGRLPANIGISSTPLQHAPFESGIHFPTLAADKVHTYAMAYFNTFNVVYPVLYEEMFMKDVLPRLLSTGFHYGDSASVLTLFVLALGQLAAESQIGAPTKLISGQSSGICGGTADYPPGLEIFNEGRARIGALVLQGDISSIQVLLLEATYFQANGCHVEYWRAITQASMGCQLLTQSPSVAWESMTGDLLRRAFWICVVEENFYHHDLDLPRTTIDQFADKVWLPNFSRALGSSKWTGGDKIQTLGEFYFLAKVSLQRTITSIHQAVQDYARRFENLHNYSDPPLHVLRELDRQLDAWRTQLPIPLRWSDRDVGLVSEEDTGAERPADFATSMIALGDQASLNKAGADILAVELRARFYSARFSLLRPFIFKALHFPQRMDTQDADYAVAAIEAACLLPAALAPARQKKRLVPHPFTWTQNYIAALSILWIAQRDEYLGQLYSERLDEKRVDEVIKEMLHWIQDVEQIDSTANWGWNFLQPMFAKSQRMSES